MRSKAQMQLPPTDRGWHGRVVTVPIARRWIRQPLLAVPRTITGQHHSKVVSAR